MKRIITYIPVFAAVIFLASCNKVEDGDLSENQVYFARTSGETVKELPVALHNTFEDVVVATVPKKTDADVTLTLGVDPSLVDEFNMKYGEHCLLLPEEFYSFSETRLEIAAGNVSSPEVTVNFNNVLTLDVENDVTYVLPVVIKNASVPIIPSRSVKYYVFRAAGIINVVPDLDGKVDSQGNNVDYGNFFTVRWKNPDVIQGLTAFTFEAYAYVEYSSDGQPTYSKSPNRRTPDNMYSLMGAENGILVRRWGNIENKKWNPFPELGDDPDVRNALEIKNLRKDGETREGMTLPDFPERKWTAFTLTYDQATGWVYAYYDQKLVHSERIGMCDCKIFPGNIEKDNDLFHIGYSNSMIRWWPGCVCEVRIWNRALTPEEIAEPLHPYYVDTDDKVASEGIVAYWKLDEGTGTICRDSSGNGNDGEANKVVNWKKIKLPEEKIQFN